MPSSPKLPPSAPCSRCSPALARRGAEAVSVPRRERRLGVHGSAARRRAAVSRAAGRAAVREARGAGCSQRSDAQRRRAGRAEHLLRADSDRFSARADRERVGRYAAHGPHSAAAAQRDGARRRRQDRRARRSALRLRVRVPTGRARRRASARRSRTGCRMRCRAPSASRRRSPTRRRTRTRRASTPSTS